VVRSLKWQIQLWHLFLLLVVLIFLGVGFYHVERRHLLAETDKQLDLLIHPLVGPLTRHQRRRNRRPLPSSPPRPEVESQPADGWVRFHRHGAAGEMSGEVDGSMPYSHRLFEEVYVPEGYYAMVVRTDRSDLRFVSSNFPEGLQMPDRMAGGHYLRDRGRRYREIYHETRGFRVLVGVNLDSLQAELERLKVKILLGCFGLLSGTMLIGTALVSRTLRPLKDIEETTNRIAKADLSARIPLPAESDAQELHTLSENLNAAFAQLESLFQRQIRFTADASHELKNPLAALMAQIEYGLKQSRSPEEVTHLLNVCARSAARIQRITEQLTELSRYDTGQMSMEFMKIPLHSVLSALSAELEPYIREHGGELQLFLQEVSCECDPFKIEQVITNLVTNAVVHNQTAVIIQLYLRLEAEFCIIEVHDNGKGIAGEHLDKLFDRFFQENPSQHAQGGEQHVGLGLAISNAIVNAHGGQLTAVSEPGQHTAFCIKLPLRAVRAVSS